MNQTTLLKALGNVDGAVVEASINGSPIAIIRYFNYVNARSFLSLYHEGYPRLCPSCHKCWHILEQDSAIDAIVACMTGNTDPLAESPIWARVQVVPWK